MLMGVLHCRSAHYETLQLPVWPSQPLGGSRSPCRASAPGTLPCRCHLMSHAAAHVSSSTRLGGAVRCMQCSSRALGETHRLVLEQAAGVGVAEEPTSAPPALQAG